MTLRSVSQKTDGDPPLDSDVDGGAPVGAGPPGAEPPAGPERRTYETARRLATVQDALAAGQTRLEVVGLMSRTYGISSRATDLYIAKARAAFQRDADRDRPRLRAETRARLLRRIRQFEAEKAYTALAATERLLAQVDGALAPTEIAQVDPGAAAANVAELDGVVAAFQEGLERAGLSKDARTDILRDVLRLAREYREKRQSAAVDEPAADARALAELAAADEQDVADAAADDGE